MSSRAVLLVATMTAALGVGCAHGAGSGAGVTGEGLSRAELRQRAAQNTGWELTWADFSLDVEGAWPDLKGAAVYANVVWPVCYTYLPAAATVDKAEGSAFSFHLEGELPRETVGATLSVLGDLNENGTCDEGEPVWHLDLQGLHAKERIVLGAPLSASGCASYMGAYLR